MATPLDLLYVALFAVALPLWDTFVSWPAFERQLAIDPAQAKKKLWVESIVYSWTIVGLGALLWHFQQRPWAALGFSMPDGWRLWGASSLVLLLAAYLALGAVSVDRDAKAREGVRKQFTGKLADVMPRTRPEMALFGGVALTAGFCEECLFRGFFIWALSPWIGWWGAAALSLAIFALGHLYQGWSGVIRTGLIGLLFTIVVAVSGSLWPAIALHAILDLGQGVMARLALREADS